MTWRIHIQDEPWAMRTNLYLVDRSQRHLEFVEGDFRSGIHALVSPWAFEKSDSRTVIPGPTMVFEEGEMDELLQAFSDAAWERGIRPSQIEDQRNQVKAMEGHLVDLRRVAFKLLKIGE